MNSGLKNFLTSPITLSFILSNLILFSPSSSSDKENPINLSCLIISEPKLLVITTNTFLKSTCLPLESVKCPSSKICSNMLKTSG